MIIISAVKTEIFVKLVFPLFSISFLLLALVPIIELKLKEQKDGLIFTYLDYSQLKY